jgi:hypothetical protein
MSNALDLFRAQQAAVKELLERTQELSGRIGQVQAQVHTLTHDPDLRAVLKDEQLWLDRARLLIDETRQWREQEARRHLPALAYRWIAALSFALISAYAVGLGYARVAKPFAAELDALRHRAELGLLVEHRMATMTAAERRQLDALMNWKRGTR